MSTFPEQNGNKLLVARLEYSKSIRASDSPNASRDAAKLTTHRLPHIIMKGGVHFPLLYRPRFLFIRAAGSNELCYKGHFYFAVRFKISLIRGAIPFMAACAVICPLNTFWNSGTNAP